MPRPHPREFRDDVVRVARDRDSGVTVEQIAKDFGIHPMTLFKWMRQGDADAGTRPGVSGGESAELREAHKRIKLLGQENEVLAAPQPNCRRRICRERLYPLGSELAVDGIPWW